MVAAQILLTDEESESLSLLAQRTGKTKEALLREAVRQYLQPAAAEDRLTLRQKAQGLWRDRDDLPDFVRLRTEFDRS